MPKSEKPIVKDDILFTGVNQISVGSQSWFDWLATARAFSFRSPGGNFAAQCEKRRNKSYWYAYRRSGKLTKVYLGKSEELTLERLEQASLSLTGQTRLKHLSDETMGNENLETESRIDTSFLPQTKVNVPVLPRQLVPRPRLTRQINTPLTVINAPSGFGKSTLLNDWKRTCGHPVAWLSLDESDNDLVRFWHSVTLALRTIDPEFGGELLAYLSTASPVQPFEVAFRLINDMLQNESAYPRFGLVLDDLHLINRTDIYDSIQSLLEHLPSNMQLIILGHRQPPLLLGHLRARGLLTELDANDLRFTLEEGIAYLRQYQQATPLSHDDLAKLVRHTEGWAAGLTLAALALSKQENPRQFVDTFSGAHIYLREYFMETVLQRSSPDVQAFLLKTSILKQLTGGLCDAVTAQTGGEEMLAHLWHENLFIVQVDEQGWYRYHDLFAEMLLSLLQARFPDEVPQLHKRAAQWYRTQYAPADAIYHLLVIEAWDEAALLMEEMALRELEQYGEDSRLLRWLQELPASVVQKHRTLLFVYLRLAYMALPRQATERFIAQIQTNLSGRSMAQQTSHERDVLVEIQQIQQAWENGDQLTLSARRGSANDSKWELLNGLHVLRQTSDPDADLWERQIADLLHKAQARQNLFVVLMAGGVLARRAYVNGQLRRSERISRQVLEQALAQRGRLPETASITLSTLSQVYLERNELGLAQRYLAEALEVDPNPTSTNMLVQMSIQHAQLQMAQGNYAEALANSRSTRDLHSRRPSGIWSDQELLTYEAFIHIRMGDLTSAERILNETANRVEHGLSQLARAEISLVKKQADVAEKQLSSIISQYPNGVVYEPLMRARVLLAKVLFDQHKIHQALQVIKDAIRLAAPEQFIRPFLDSIAICPPLLSLASQAENMTIEAHAFIKRLLSLSNTSGEHSHVAQSEIDALSASASISPREQEVLHLISAGYSNREMAGKLSISESTVKTHVGNIYYKLNVNGRIQAITRAKELKLV